MKEDNKNWLMLPSQSLQSFVLSEDSDYDDGNVAMPMLMVALCC